MLRRLAVLFVLSAATLLVTPFHLFNYIPLGEPSIYAAWRIQQSRRLANPAFTPLGGPSNHAAWRAQQSRRLAAPATTPLGEPSNHAAWRTQQPRRLAGPATTPLGEPSNYAAWRGQCLSRLTNPATTPLGEASVYPTWCVANPKFCTEKSLPPLAGDGAPMKKMLAFFSWVPGKVAEGRKGG